MFNNKENTVMRKRSYKPRAKGMEAKVRKIANDVVARNIETKWYTQTAGLTFGNQTGALTLLNNITQNVGLTNRIGCKVHLKGLRLTGLVGVIAPTTDFNRASIRLMVVHSTQPLAAADVLTQLQGPRDHNTYSVLHDEIINFKDNQRNVTFIRDVNVNKVVKFLDATSSPENYYLYSFFIGLNVAGTTTIAGYTQTTGYQLYFKDA